MQFYPNWIQHSNLTGSVSHSYRQNLSRIQTLMTHIPRTCQEIRDIKNPLRSRKSKLINKVYLRPPGPNHDNNKEHLLDKYGEGGQGDTYSCGSTPTPPLDQCCNPCTNQGDEEHSSSPLPSPVPISPGASHAPTPTNESAPSTACKLLEWAVTPCTADPAVSKLP